MFCFSWAHFYLSLGNAFNICFCCCHNFKKIIRHTTGKAHRTSKKGRGLVSIILGINLNKKNTQWMPIQEIREGVPCLFE